MVKLNLQLQEINDIVAAAKDAIFAAKQSSILNILRIKYFGKKGVITYRLKELNNISAEQRPVIGKLVNWAKKEITHFIEEREKLLAECEINTASQRETLDVSLPGRGENIGGLHPVTRTLKRIECYFQKMGFSITEGQKLRMVFIILML